MNTFQILKCHHVFHFVPQLLIIFFLIAWKLCIFSDFVCVFRAALDLASTFSEVLEADFTAVFDFSWTMALVACWDGFRRGTRSARDWLASLLAKSLCAAL